VHVLIAIITLPAAAEREVFLPVTTSIPLRTDRENEGEEGKKREQQTLQVGLIRKSSGAEKYCEWREVKSTSAGETFS
jgi:hypothetical protein